MKNLIKAVFFLLAASLISCDPNVPELNDANRKMLLGCWEVEKETMTNGDGFGSVYTRSGENLTRIEIFTFLENQVIIDVRPTSLEHGDYHAIDTLDYVLQEQDNRTWLLTIPGRYDQPRNLDGGCSPITIRKLTKNKLEWEYEAYGGDEGPVGYRKYLGRQ